MAVIQTAIGIDLLVWTSSHHQLHHSAPKSSARLVFKKKSYKEIQYVRLIQTISVIKSVAGPEF